MNQRLGVNAGGYRGETIDIQEVLGDIKKAATTHGWELDTLSVSDRVQLLCLGRGPLDATDSVYISAGIHGDEPAGPLAVCRLLHEDIWPPGLRLFVCPCLNPDGFVANRREDADGFDLNRDYLHLQSPSIGAHVAWLSGLPPFGVAVCLHEDWESQGFYVYELNPDGRPSLAEDIVHAVAAVCPIDASLTIEGRPAAGGIIRPEASVSSRPQWPEAFYLLQHKTRQTYTLEAPSDFPLRVRVDALVAGVRAVLNSYDVTHG